MASPFRSFTNAPNPFAGAHAKDVQVAMVAIEAIRKQIDRDEIGPTQVLAHGKLVWINTFLREMSGFRLVDRGHAEILWRWFEERHQSRFPGMAPQQVLDQWHEASPITQAEIDKGWTVDSASSYEARTRFYGRDGNPDNLLKQLVDDQPVVPGPAPDITLTDAD